jgi:hypothetical protein
MESDLTQSDKNWLAALGLLEGSRRFGTGKVISLAKANKKKPLAESQGRLEAN